MPAPAKTLLLLAAVLPLAAAPVQAQALVQPNLPSLENLPRPSAPPLERGPVVPAQVERWRQEAKGHEHGENGFPRDAVRAAELYCRAARHGDAESQFSLAWMLTNSRGILRDEAQAAHLFAAAAEQGLVQAQNILARMGTPRGDPPACLRPPDEDRQLVEQLEAQQRAQQAAMSAATRPGSPALLPGRVTPPPPPPPNAPEAIVRYVQLVAPEFGLQPHLVLAVMNAESNFDPNAVSPKNAQGLMQLIPDTAARFGVRNIKDPVQNIQGGMRYLRWLLARFEGDVSLALAAYNAGEGAVERYLGVPPFAETRLYVLKIRAAIGGQLRHPFDPAVTEASAVLPRMRATWLVR